MADHDDSAALACLAQLARARPLRAPVLLAEVAGAPAAALSLCDLRFIASRNGSSHALVDLLRVRGRQIRGDRDAETRA